MPLQGLKFLFSSSVANIYRIKCNTYEAVSVELSTRVVRIR